MSSHPQSQLQLQSLDELETVRQQKRDELAKVTAEESIIRKRRQTLEQELFDLDDRIDEVEEQKQQQKQKQHQKQLHDRKPQAQPQPQQRSQQPPREEVEGNHHKEQELQQKQQQQQQQFEQDENRRNGVLGLGDNQDFRSYPSNHHHHDSQQQQQLLLLQQQQLQPQHYSSFFHNASTSTSTHFDSHHSTTAAGATAASATSRSTAANGRTQGRIDQFFVAPSRANTSAAASASASATVPAATSSTSIDATHNQQRHRDQQLQYQRQQNGQQQDQQQQNEQQQMILQILRQTFRIQNFRQHQLQIIQSTLHQQDCFVLMRTGGGKSLTYQLPAVYEMEMATMNSRRNNNYTNNNNNKITVVVSPLLSLIEDQVEQMNKFVPNSCVAFHSGVSATQQSDQWDRILFGSRSAICMILITPEKIQQSTIMKRQLAQLHSLGRLGRFVIDECHCCSQWGHDFRPDYAKLSCLKYQFPNVPILAVTATASDEVRNDVCNILRLDQHHKFFRSTADRPNLKYMIKPKELCGTGGTGSDIIMEMVKYIKALPSKTHAGIIYTLSKKDAEHVASELQKNGITAAPYHANVSTTQKQRVHNRWKNNQIQVVVATIAFGLGINKPDVRFVLHHTMSKTLEAYYQESGRAGRDGQPADCILYTSPKDIPRMLKMIHRESNSQQFTTMMQYANELGDDQRCRVLLLHNLGENPPPGVDLESSGYIDGVEQRDVTSHVKTVLQLMYHCQQYGVSTAMTATTSGTTGGRGGKGKKRKGGRKSTKARIPTKMTLAMLVKEWRQKVPTNKKAENNNKNNKNNKTTKTTTAQVPDCIVANPPGKSNLTPSDCERIIIGMLLQNLIKINVRYTKYDAVIYFEPEPQRGERFLTSETSSLKVPLPTRKQSTSKSKDKTTKSKPAATTKKSSTSKASSKRSSTTLKQQSSKNRTSSSRTPSDEDDDSDSCETQDDDFDDIIDIDDDDEDDYLDDDVEYAYDDDDDEDDDDGVSESERKPAATSNRYRSSSSSSSSLIRSLPIVAGRGRNNASTAAAAAAAAPSSTTSRRHSYSNKRQKTSSSTSSNGHDVIDLLDDDDDDDDSDDDRLSIANYAAKRKRGTKSADAAAATAATSSRESSPKRTDRTVSRNQNGRDSINIGRTGRRRFPFLDDSSEDEHADSGDSQGTSENEWDEHEDDEDCFDDENKASMKRQNSVRNRSNLREGHATNERRQVNHVDRQDSRRQTNGRKPRSAAIAARFANRGIDDDNDSIGIDSDDDGDDDENDSIGIDSDDDGDDDENEF